MSNARNPSEEELRQLRHDLRTPFNHLIGYTEMLLESAEDAGCEGCRSGLEALHADARDLLGRINDALAPGRTVGRGDLAELGQTIMSRGALLGAELACVGERAGAGAPAEFVADLERMRASLGALGRLAAGLTGAPARPRPESAPEVQPAAVGPGPARVWGRVLVVDDDATNRDVLLRRLQREGYATEAAEGGRQALEMVATGKFDLVLLDLMMPEVDGYQVLLRVKIDPALRDIPVIMISALDELASVVRCIEAGADDYLPKPFDPVLLRARVTACLEKKRRREQELEYLRGVEAVEAAAAAVEAGTFEASSLEAVAGRDDELGRLARVFQHMAVEVLAREQRYQSELRELRIEIDEARKQRAVAEIASKTDFEDLKNKARRLREQWGKQAGEAGPGGKSGQ
jgi:DNA-binding response OmpR family regulator